MLSTIGISRKSLNLKSQRNLKQDFWAQAVSSLKGCHPQSTSRWWPWPTPTPPCGRSIWTWSSCCCSPWLSSCLIIPSENTFLSQFLPAPQSTLPPSLCLGSRRLSALCLVSKQTSQQSLIQRRLISRILRAKLYLVQCGERNLESTGNLNWKCKSDKKKIKSLTLFPTGQDIVWKTFVHLGVIVVLV